VIVADTNLIVYLFLTGDQTRLAQKVLAKDPNWIVPPLWQSEFRNVLAAYIRRGMAVSRAKRLMSDALQTLEKREILPPYEKVLDLITESNYTAYNCEFVALANELNVQLVTADKQLLTRFPERTISLEEFVK
jgi:predicted nucleic acid-binding protein